MTEREPTDGHAVELPAEVTERIEARLAETQFETVDAYAATALDVLLRQVTRLEAEDATNRPTGAGTDGQTAGSSPDGQATGSSPDEQAPDGQRDGQTDPDSEVIAERLESLGYL